ncbi:MAG: dodecin family protein [Methanomassiliicoccales archaeon]|nr:dodecin family protein [Methanomassiliicoccales archaeon]
MVQKIIDIVGISDDSFAKAAQNAVDVASKSVRGMKWARVGEMECKIEGSRVIEYRTLMRIYFEVER